jgi:glucosamine 6-phosphate synthetase-like amidotransferase/phosphosugar isomerase protein
MNNVDYGFKEKAYVLTQDDCFTKLFADIETENGKLNKLQGNISILHTRFAEVNKFYKIDQGLSGIPDEHAQPNIDKKSRFALFQNGVVSNFEELW